MRGKVSFGVYQAYAKALGGCSVVVAIIGLFTASQARLHAALTTSVKLLTVSALLCAARVGGYSEQAAVVGSNWFLSRWSSNTDAHSTQSENVSYLQEYAGLCLLSIAILVVQRLTIAFAAVRAGKVLHNSLLDTILRLPMSFFDTTPLGRVLNRYALGRGLCVCVCL